MGRSFIGQTSLSRGLRNNNPFNLRRSSNAWQGKIPFAQSTDKDFEQFHEIHWGIRAGLIQIRTDFGRGLNTVSKFLTKFAPPSENNTASYIATVAGALGVNKDAVIDLTRSAHIALAKAIVKVELGAAAYEKLLPSDFEDAYIYLNSSYGDGTIPEVTINAGQKTCKACGAIIAGALLFFFTFFAITV